MQEAVPNNIISEFTHGTIVAIKPHHFEKDVFSTVLAGNPLSISPLMIVVEELFDSRTSYNERTGEEISKSGNSQCKCMWFSTKKQEFIDAWFPSKFLKVIKKIDLNRERIIQPDKNANLNVYTGKSVLFRTCNLETHKRKSSIAIKSNDLNESSTIVPLLNFVSPIMQIVQVMEYKNIDPKEVLFDAKTGNKKRHLSEWVAKCRWYNSELEKTSEKLIPLDCLEELIPINKEYLAFLQQAIVLQKYLINDKTIIKPHKLIFLNGDYFLRGYSYVANKIINKDIKKLGTLSVSDTYFTDRARMFDPETGEILTKIEGIKKAEEGGAYLRIKYSKGKNEETTRTLSKFKLVNMNNAKGELTDYLIGYDHLRKANRTFLVKRIKSLKILKLNFSPPSLEGVLEKSLTVLE